VSTRSSEALQDPPTGPARASPHSGRTQIELHAPDPVCRVAPDWQIAQIEGSWRATDVSGRWPLREPWWLDPRARAPRMGGIIHLLICCWGADGLPTGPAELAGELVANLMESYDAARPHGHYARGRASTPAGLAASEPPPLDCPPWEFWGQEAEDARFGAAQRIRAPLTERTLRRFGGLGG